MLAHERGGLLQCGLGIVDHLVARRLVSVGQLQRGLDRLLLLFVARLRRHFRCARLVLQHGLRDAVHILAHALQFGACTLTDLLPRQRGIQRELQLLVVLFRTDAEVALGVRHQSLVQPGLLLVHGLLQAVDGGLQALLVGLRQLADVRGDEGIDDAEDALVLLGHGLGMDLRHACRIQVLAGLGEDRRQLFHARGGRLQALRQRRELARHQAVDRAAGNAVVQLRVPLAGLHHLGIPDFRLQLVAQDRGIHLVLAAQLGHVDLVQFAQQALVGVDGLLLAGRAQVVDLAVIAVVADLGGADRGQLHPGIQGTLGQVGEGGVDRRISGLLAGGRGGTAGRGIGRLATGEGGDEGEGKKMRAHRHSCTGSILEHRPPGLLCPRAIGLPWAHTRTLQRSAGHGIPGKLPLRQDRIHRAG
ncbi:hypothetical protein D3C81_1170450 [compost metagenome]